jgi:hypothetical protein
MGNGAGNASHRLSASGQHSPTETEPLLMVLFVFSMDAAESPVCGSNSRCTAATYVHL